jgi:uncharacterized protein (TIRG00374 family)
MNKQALRYILSALLTIVFLSLAFRGTDVPAFLDSLKRADYWWILAMFALLILSHVVRAWRWRYLLEPIKPAIGMRSLVSGVMVGYMVNNVLPRAGELVRPYTIGKLEGVPKSAAFGTIIVERIIDTIAFLALVALVPLVYNGPLRETFPWLDDARFIVGVVTATFIVVLVVMMFRRDWTNMMISFVTKVLPKRLALLVEKLTHQFLDGFLFLKRPKHFGLIFVQSVAIWYLYICMVYVAFFAFHLNLDFSAAIVVQAISSIGVAIPTPGGTGSYHMFASQSLSQLFGVSDTIALSYATVTHGFGYVGTTIIGGYFFLKDHIKVSEAVVTPKERA